jgi:transposase
MTKPAIAVLGVDLGKNSCSLAALDASGAVVLRRKMKRETVIAFTAALPACTIAMEACCGAHFLGRAFEAQGHLVRLMSPEYVQPYVKAQKTDDRDAEAIAEDGSADGQYADDEEENVAAHGSASFQIRADARCGLNQFRLA